MKLQIFCPDSENEYLKNNIQLKCIITLDKNLGNWEKHRLLREGNDKLVLPALRCYCGHASHDSAATLCTWNDVSANSVQDYYTDISSSRYGTSLQAMDHKFYPKDTVLWEDVGNKMLRKLLCVNRRRSTKSRKIVASVFWIWDY